MNEKTLIATVGLPRSGKSTWAKQQGIPVVNPDSIRLAMHGQRFIADAEPFVWATVKVMVRALFLAGHDKVILDSTNNTRKHRDEWQSPNKWMTLFKYFETPASECIARARMTDDEEIVPVIERMAKVHEPLADYERPLL